MQTLNYEELDAVVQKFKSDPDNMETVSRCAKQLRDQAEAGFVHVAMPGSDPHEFAKLNEPRLGEWPIIVPLTLRDCGEENFHPDTVKLIHALNDRQVLVMFHAGDSHIEAVFGPASPSMPGVCACPLCQLNARERN